MFFDAKNYLYIFYRNIFYVSPQYPRYTRNGRIEQKSVSQLSPRVATNKYIVY